MIPKFRCWDGQDKVMRNVECLMFPKNSNEINVVIEGESFATGPDLILMQSTGLKDKNDVEIFEGDVVKVTDGESEEDSYITIVKNYSNEGYPAFDIEYPPTYHYDSNVLSAIMCNVFETIEVIGNVWDNPELLEVAE